MNSFSLNRFGKTLRWVVSVNFRSLLMWTIGSALGVFLYEVMMQMIVAYHNPYYYVWGIADVGEAFMVIASVVFVCTVVSCIKDRLNRTTFLMLPSSNLEKYLALVFYVTVICVLCMFLAFVVGDMLRMAWFWGSHVLSGKEAVSSVQEFNGVENTYYFWSSSVEFTLSKMIPRLMTVWGSGIYWTWANEWSTLIYHVLLAVWVHSVYTLGGTLLRKYAFAITSVVLWTVVILSFRITEIFDLSIYNWVDHVLHGITGMGVVVCFVLLAFSIVNYWASFHIFKHFELITNKWTNYDILKR
jgi:hypothetical protein